MVKGIGVDTVEIQKIVRLMEQVPSFVTHTFSLSEQRQSLQRENRAEYLAGRFAIKEAVFKSLAQLLPEKTFDFRVVESANTLEGAPYIVITEDMTRVLQKADVSQLLVSVTSEAGLVTAFVIAVG